MLSPDWQAWAWATATGTEAPLPDVAELVVGLEPRIDQELVDRRRKAHRRALRKARSLDRAKYDRAAEFRAWAKESGVKVPDTCKDGGAS